MVTVALTGGTGLLGRALLPLLCRRGHRLRVLVRPRSDRALPDLDGVSWIDGRLDQTAALDGLLRDADCVLHAAYQPPEPPPLPDRSQAEHWVQSNIVGTLRLLERTAGLRGRQLVYVSSLAVYGADPDQDPLGERFARDEDFPLWPREFYGSMRAACEKLVITAAHSHGLNTSVFRLGCVLGLREPWTDSPLHATVAEAVRDGEIRRIVGTYSISVQDSARVLADAVGDASVAGQVYNTFDRWFDHADAAPWIGQQLGRTVRVARPPALEPRSPIRGDRIHARCRDFATEAAARELVHELVARCSRERQGAPPGK